MTKSIKPQLYAACRRLLRPIVRFLLNGGVTSKEFAEISKLVFVEVAVEDYGLQGRPTNSSRVAILTDLSRREVKRIRDILSAEKPRLIERISSATRVLSAWHQDPDFVDKNGRPKILRLDGKSASFTELLRRYAGDIPSSAMLKELKNVGAIEETKSGRLKVLTRYYMAAKLDPDGILRAGNVIHDLAATLHNNLCRPARTVSRIEGRASNMAMTPKTAKAFREFINKKGEEFLETIDNWLTEHRVDDSVKTRTKRLRLGAGVYAIEEKLD